MDNGFYRTNTDYVKLFFNVNLINFYQKPFHMPTTNDSMCVRPRLNTCHLEKETERDQKKQKTSFEIIVFLALLLLSSSTWVNIELWMKCSSVSYNACYFRVRMCATPLNVVIRINLTQINLIKPNLYIHETFKVGVLSFGSDRRRHRRSHSPAVKKQVSY